MTRYPLSVVAALCMAGAALAVPLHVEQQSAQVRGTPSALAQVVTTLTYGQTVEGLATQGDWQQVRTPAGATGWVQRSALAANQPRLSGSGGASVKTGASAKEMALAGKGFGKAVEVQFRADHPGLDFSWVDRMERTRVPSSELQRFAKAGGLPGPGGVQ